MGGQTKVNVGIARVWVYLDDNASRAFAAGAAIAGIIGGLADPELVTKVALACAGVAGAIVSAANHGNGVIIKIPHVLGSLAGRPPEIVSQ